MNIDLSGYSGYYTNYESGSWESYDVIILITPEWWIPDKKLKFLRIKCQVRLDPLVVGGRFIREGNIVTQSTISPDYLDALNYIKNYFNKEI